MKSSIGMPGLDDEVIGWRTDFGDHHFGEVDEETVGPGRAVVAFDFAGGPGDFGVAWPKRGVLVGVDGAAMQRYSVVASKVDSSESAAHHPDRQVVVGEGDFGSADSRRPVVAQRGHGVVLVCTAELPDPLGQVGLGGCEVLPGGHGAILALAGLVSGIDQRGPLRSGWVDGARFGGRVPVAFGGPDAEPEGVAEALDFMDELFGRRVGEGVEMAQRALHLAVDPDQVATLCVAFTKHVRENT